MKIFSGAQRVVMTAGGPSGGLTGFSDGTAGPAIGSIAISKIKGFNIQTLGDNSGVGQLSLTGFGSDPGTSFVRYLKVGSSAISTPTGYVFSAGQAFWNFNAFGFSAPNPYTIEIGV